MIAGCGSSADGESSDRSAVNNDASGFEDYFDNNPTGENILSILGAGYPDALPTCNNDDSKNVMLIANTTNAPQTLSVTINPGLEEEAAFFPQYSSTIGTGPCPGYGELPNTQSLTVQPGQTAVALLVAGGGDRNLLETSKDIAIGAGGQQWYNFELNLDINEGFDNLQLSYEGTGGTDPSLNLQPGLFNVMQCDTSNGVAVTNTIVSTYYPMNGVQYSQNQPMCFAFLSDGSDSPTSTIAAWDSRAAHQIGDLVTYQGATYRCTEAYQGYGDPSWILAPDLWVKVS